LPTPKAEVVFSVPKGKLEKRKQIGANIAQLLVFLKITLKCLEQDFFKYFPVCKNAGVFTAIGLPTFSLFLQQQILLEIKKAFVWSIVAVKRLS